MKNRWIIQVAGVVALFGAVVGLAAAVIYSFAILSFGSDDPVTSQQLAIAFALWATAIALGVFSVWTAFLNRRSPVGTEPREEHV